jgi:membrane peptidoglycan carboxypeptidase
VVAQKLESKYSKDQIMGLYLNYVDLGEGRYGIEAAAEGYFGKSVLTPAGQPNAITPYEAAVLASIIKQPYPTSSYGGYDPNYNKSGAQGRWDYTLQNMLDMGWITQAQFDQRKYPTNIKKPNSGKADTSLNKPADIIIRHVRSELTSMGISQEQFDKGGLTITTTINPKVQKAAEQAGSRLSKTSPLHGRPSSYQSTVIGIDPSNGEVLGYYGGDDPNGTDYGGYLSGDGSKIIGGVSPGSTFKIYTLSAALKEDISFDTRWDGTVPKTNGTPISNAGQDPGITCLNGGGIKDCKLETATIKSYNFAFYDIARAIGRQKVIQAAEQAGIKHMFTDSSKLVDLSKTNQSTWLSSGYFDNEVAFGQYRVVPLEHAEGVATVVDGGVHRPAHFIKSVKEVDADSGKTVLLGAEKDTGNRVFDANQMSNLQGVMKEIVDADDRDLKGDREAIAKSGTWEYKEGSGDCWFVGGIPQMAATVWVGAARNKVELKEPTGGDMFGAGTPAKIWKQFLDTASAAMGWSDKEFPQRVKTGDPDSKFQNGQKPAPPPVQQQQQQPQQTCVLGFVGDCDNNGNGNGNGGNNGGQTNDPGNGGNPNNPPGNGGNGPGDGGPNDDPNTGTGGQRQPTGQ